MCNGCVSLNVSSRVFGNMCNGSEPDVLLAVSTFSAMVLVLRQHTTTKPRWKNVSHGMIEIQTKWNVEVNTQYGFERVKKMPRQIVAVVSHSCNLHSYATNCSLSDARQIHKNTEKRRNSFFVHSTYVKLVV